MQATSFFLLVNKLQFLPLRLPRDSGWTKESVSRTGGEKVIRD
jgi:hypothetical protein